MSVSTEESLDILNDVDVDDPTKTHMIYFPSHMESGEAWLAEARAKGLEVEALCGHKFVPERDPMKHPLCEPCIEIAGIIVSHDG